ncbi:RDD family protein [Gracilibacillus sp. S3-1-1]|uniref:RDD family protein n=1 Tax=Gracilibacillus pellucidus TaxID=3095368 RepID=A0ACC6M5X1_9BACI|nr:RDD family protein [Gracilibacillus sp. S3-1-1]MDX8046390.1 RDD family protein [Gracilibacillus sp. S3-1-1]
MEQEQLQIKTPEYVSLQFRLAGLGSRAAALLIDNIILSVVQFLIILSLILPFSTTDFLFSHFDSIAFAIVLISIFVLQFGYYIFFEYFWGGKTLGKKILGIRVVQENGHNITFLSSIIRNLLRLIDMLPGAYALGILLVFAHPKHKRLGDLAAGTIVVHERRKKSFKPSALEKHIANLGLQKEELPLEAFHLKQFNQKDWQLLKTYAERIVDISPNEKATLTEQVSNILLPKISTLIESNTRGNEANLLLLYLHLKDEWEFS